MPKLAGGACWFAAWEAGLASLEERALWATPKIASVDTSTKVIKGLVHMVIPFCRDGFARVERMRDKSCSKVGESFHFHRKNFVVQKLIHGVKVVDVSQDELQIIHLVAADQIVGAVTRETRIGGSAFPP